MKMAFGGHRKRNFSNFDFPINSGLIFDFGSFFFEFFQISLIFHKSPVILVFLSGDHGFSNFFMFLTFFVKFGVFSIIFPFRAVSPWGFEWRRFRKGFGPDFGPRF